MGAVPLGDTRQAKLEGWSLLRHVASSTVAAFLVLTFAITHLSASIQQGRPLGLVLGLGEILSAVIFFTRRPPKERTDRVADWLVTFGAMYVVLLVRPGGPVFAWSDPVGVTLQVLGFALGTMTILTLRRSMGFVPANRGVVTSGPYAVVRHPMYAAYFIGQVGYLVQSPRFWNVCVLTIAAGLQLVRILNEERLLSLDEDYRWFMNRTRYRLIPGLW